MAKFYYYLGHEQYDPEVLLEQAVMAEEAGFDGLFVSEHFNPWVDDAGHAGFGFATLGAIAAATKKIHLMTGVVTPLFRYHPAVIAQAAATIDRLSSGRFELGVGTGEAINEEPLGYAFPDYEERSARMQEALFIIEKLLDGQRLEFSGTYYKTEGVKLYSPPVHKIPVLLAAGGPKSATLAAQKSDGLIISVKDPKTAIEKIIEPAKKAAPGKSLMTAASRWVMYAPTPEDGWLALRPWRGLRAPGRNTAIDPKMLQMEADKIPKEKIMESFRFARNARDYVDAYLPLATDLKADVVAIQTSAVDQSALIKMLGTEVLPVLREAS